MRLFTVLGYLHAPALIAFALLARTANTSNAGESAFVTPAKKTKVIENRTFDGKGLLVDGREFDGLVVRKCKFLRSPQEAIYLKNVPNVKIEDCTIKGSGSNGILAGFEAQTPGLVIEGCDISDCQRSGIGGNVGAPDAILRNNHIHNVGHDKKREAGGAPGHGIYWSSPNVLIEQNHIHGIVNKGGVGISIRSSGIVARNKVHHCNGRDAIAYFSNYPGRGGRIVIENNIVFDCDRGIGAEGYNLANNVATIVIRFNTVLQKNANLSIYLGDNLQFVESQVYGNLLVNEAKPIKFIHSASKTKIHSNLECITDVGFVDREKRDLHLKVTSKARNAIRELAEFPKVDFDGDARRGTSLSFGADQ